MEFATEQAPVVKGKKGKGQGKRGGKGKGANTEYVQGDESNTKGQRDPNWTDPETTLFLELLAEVQSRRQDPYSTCGFSDLEWSYVHSAFTKKNTEKHKRDLKSLKLRWKNLKGAFSFFKEIANKSGCNWNDEEHVPDVPEDVWTDVEQKDLTRYKRYAKKSFPWYRQVESLYGKSVASGRSNITSDLNKQIPRNFTEVSSSEDENGAAQQELDDFSLPAFREMAADGFDSIAPDIDATHDPIPEQNDGTTYQQETEPVNGAPGSSNPATVGAPSTQKRKRVNNTSDPSSRRTKPPNCANRMDEFAEKFLEQQQKRTEIIANIGQANCVKHDQVREKLGVLALPPDVHTDMEMSLGNSWIRECFLKENNKERLMMIVDRAIGLFRSGRLSLNS